MGEQGRQRAGRHALDPRGLAVDSATHQMYWADVAAPPLLSTKDNTGIWRLNPPNDRTRLYTSTGRYPFGLALDSDARKLYWADGSSWPSQIGDTIMTAALDGSGPKKLISDAASWVAVGLVPSGPTGTRTDLALAMRAFPVGGKTGDPIPAGTDFRYAIDPTKIESELGWRATIGFENGIRRTIDWYLANTQWTSDIRSGAYRS